MPFDAAGFPERREEPPDRPRPSDNAICAIIVVVFVVLLLTPISLASFADIIRYLRAG